MVYDLDMIKKVYAKFPERIEAARKVVGKPLTLSETIELRGSIKDEKLQKLMQKSLQRAMEKKK